MRNPTFIFATAGLAISLGGIVYSAGIQAARIDANARTLDRHEAAILAQQTLTQQQLNDLSGRLDAKLDRLNDRLDAMLRMLAERDRRE